MKATRSTPFVIAMVSLLFLASPTAEAASRGKIFGAAAGKYKGKARGAVSSAILGTVTPVRKTGSSVKLPRGKGKFKANFGGVRIRGRVTKANVRQGGKKVGIVATGLLPASLTAPLGAPGAGTFRGNVNLGGKKPKLTGRGIFGVANLIQLNVRFAGQQ